MKTKFGMLTAAAAMIVAAPIAFAQTSSTTTTTPHTGTTGATSGTSSTMTESQMEKKLESEGYTNAKLKEDTSTSTPGDWTGTATKGGKTVNIHVDPSGKVTER